MPLSRYTAAMNSKFQCERIILLGYRGAGKTTFGMALAEKLGFDFVDVDDLTCDRFGMTSIAEIWKRHGEAAWRREEVAVARELCNREQVVIGTGGGTVMQPGAREAVAAAPYTMRVYLKCSASELHRRISLDKRSSASRPALTAHGGGLEEVRQVLAEREPVYEALADLVVDVEVPDTAKVVQAIINHLCPSAG